MGGRRKSLHAELYFGSIYGFGLSVVLWSLTRAMALADPGWLVFVLLGGLCGALSIDLPLIGRVRGVYALTLATALLFGSPASVVAAASASLTHSLVRPQGRREERIAHIAYDLGSRALAAAVAGAALHAVGSSAGPITASPAMGLLVHAAAFAAIEVSLDLLAFVVETTSASSQSPWRRAGGSLAAIAVGVLGAVLAVSAYRSPTFRPLLLLAPLAFPAYRLGRVRGGHPSPDTLACEPRDDALETLTRGLAAGLAVHDPRSATRSRRIECLSVALSRRLDLDAEQQRALSTAVRLRDIGLLAHSRVLRARAPRSVDEMRRRRMHPETGSKLLELIRYPFDVESIVRHQRERWDGSGRPDGLEGDEIPLGARILTLIEAYDSLTAPAPVGRGLTTQHALELLVAEAGSSLDPWLVDVLLENVDALEAADSTWPVVDGDDDAREESDANTGHRLADAERNLDALYAIRALAQRDLDRDENWALTAAKLRSVVPFETGAVLMPAPERHDWCVERAFGDRAARIAGAHLPLCEPTPVNTLPGIAGVPWLDRQTWLERHEFGGAVAALIDVENAPRPRSSLVVPLVHEGHWLGALLLVRAATHEFDVEERRFVLAVAGHVAALSDRRQSNGESVEDERRMTDASTGLPNARFLRLNAGERLLKPLRVESSFGLVALAVRNGPQLIEELGLEAFETVIGNVANRLAETCDDDETLVRFGPFVFVALTPRFHPGELVGRWHTLVDIVEATPFEVERADPWSARLDAAHVSAPEDGQDIEELLRTLGERLDLTRTRGRAVFPIQPAQRAG
ncbi:MAG: diguanylate cyclase [bacterium]|nr:diguanylate cyclase [bacterium]